MGDVLLAVVLVLTLRRNREEGDDGQLARTLQKVIESETDLLADQLRATQAESARSTQAAVRDLGAVLAESQRQSSAAATARLGGFPDHPPRQSRCDPHPHPRIVVRAGRASSSRFPRLRPKRRSLLPGF